MAERQRHRRWTAVGLATIVALGPTLVGVRAAVAAFVDNSVTATSPFGAAPDWVGPEVSSITVAKAAGYLAGSVKEGGAYYVYANVTDSGSPPSGIAIGGETADVRAVTAGGSAVALVAGTYSAAGVTYNYRSAELVAAIPLSAGSYQYSISSADVAGNTRVQSGYEVTVDNTVPAAADIQTTNAGTQGRAEAGDTIAFTYTERIDPQSMLAGWTGSSTTVVVRLVDGGCTLNLLVTVCYDDSFEVYDPANAAALPLGTVNLKRSDYVGGGLLGTANPITFASTMAQSGETVIVTLGTPSRTATTAGGAASMVWTPSATAYDAAGNLASTTAITESGTADKDF